MRRRLSAFSESEGRVIEDYSEVTSLQRQAKAYLKARKTLGVGLGVIERK